MTTVNQYRVWCTDVPSHYEYSWGTIPPTVCPSDGGPIDTNLTTIVQSVSNNEAEVTNLPLTAFGELSAVTSTPLLQLYFTYDNITQLVKTGTTGSGTVSNSGGMGVVSSGAAINSSASISSVKPIKYRAGQGILLRFTAIFTAGIAGNTQLVGGYDIEDGVGVGYNGVDFGLFRRSNSVTNWVKQIDWNVDKLDGTGPSGVNIDFGLGYGNVFEIQYQYLGFGGMIFKVENPSTARFTVVHIIEYSNTSTVPSFSNSSFPVCLESNNTTNNTDIILKTSSMMAAVEGTIVYTGPQFSSTWDNVSVSNGSETFIGAWKVKSTFHGKLNKSIIYATFVSFATGSTDKAQILRMRKGATFTTPTWTDIDTDQSVVQRLTAGTWDTGTGNILFQQNISGNGTPTNINITPSSTSLYGIAGDNLIITLEGLGAGSNWGSLTWLEDQ